MNDPGDQPRPEISRSHGSMSYLPECRASAHQKECPQEDGAAKWLGRQHYSGASFLTETQSFTASSSLMSPGLPMLAVSSRHLMK